MPKKYGGRDKRSKHYINKLDAVKTLIYSSPAIENHCYFQNVFCTRLNIEFATPRTD